MASKIKVDTIENVAGSGNVSLGSGHNLVVPGNITGQGTTTLTGDLAVDTDTLFADVSADKVGINNSAPNHELQINGNSTTSSLALKTSATGNATSDGLELKVQGDSAAYLYNYENAMLRFGTNGLERVRIHAGGYVTKSNQPSWFQYVIGDGTFSSGWKNVPLNPNASTSFPYHIQGGVTTANGNHEVTVPVAGQYQINGAVTLNSASVNTDGTLTISKNNSTMSGGQSSGVYSGALGGTTISMVVTLAANDTVGLDYYFSQSATYRNTAYAGYFSGYLLG